VFQNTCALVTILKTPYHVTLLRCSTIWWLLVEFFALCHRQNCADVWRTDDNAIARAVCFMWMARNIYVWRASV